MFIWWLGLVTLLSKNTKKLRVLDHDGCRLTCTIFGPMSVAVTFAPDA
jgi:hypothetical protein